MYCGDCDVDQVDDGLDEYRGLGLVPLVGAALASPTGQNVAKSIGGALVGGVKSLFGGGPDDTPSGWEQEALTGRVRCPEGGQFIYDYLDPSKRIEGHPGFRKGQYYGVSVDELDAALAQTPEGRPGDPMFTRQALKGVLRAVAPSVPAPRTNRELAQAAVYIAHGKGDCKIGSTESPVAEHIDAILQRYRASSATIPSVDADLASPGELLPGALPGALPELGTIARQHPVATVGALAALAFLASGLYR